MMCCYLNVHFQGQRVDVWSVRLKAKKYVVNWTSCNLIHVFIVKWKTCDQKNRVLILGVVGIITWLHSTVIPKTGTVKCLWLHLDCRLNWKEHIASKRKQIALTFWRRNYFFNFSTHCIENVNNTGTKQVRIMKQLCIFIYLYITINQQDAAVRSQFYCTAGLLYMFWVLSTHIIRSTLNCITASGTGHIIVAATFGSCNDNMTCTGGCRYSLMYSWWWAWKAPETCRVTLQWNKIDCEQLHLVGLL